jgi:glycosyltransferase involved in cell wall biosynthesis
MKIKSYTFVLNDELMLPFFLRYYKDIVDEMVFLDSGSTDRTLDIIKSFKRQVIPTGLTFWDWDKMRETYQTIWKGSDADYVFLMDVDEIFYHPNLRQFLEFHKGRYDIYRMEGYQMVSKTFPKEGTSILDINMGVVLPLYNKSTIFNPSVDIYHENAHEIKTTTTRICEGVIKLLHYKFLGADIMVKRTQLIKDRVPPNTYCKYIKGNILKVYPAFIKSRGEWEAEINRYLEKAQQII